MRSYIDIIEKAQNPFELFEAARIVINGKPVSILKNPTAPTLMFFIGNTRQGVARGTLIDNDLFVWDATLAAHRDILYFFNQPKGDRSYDFAERDEDHFAFACPDNVLDEALSNEHVRNAINTDRFVIAFPNGNQMTLIEYDNLG